MMKSDITCNHCVLIKLLITCQFRNTVLLKVPSACPCFDCAYQAAAPAKSPIPPPDSAKPGKAGKVSPQQQPPEPESQPAPRSRGGLSCLKPATLDEDTEPLQAKPGQAMSPSGRSISDIFGKVKLCFFSFIFSTKTITNKRNLSCLSMM